LTEPYRRQLQTHCYRMLGSLLDAEDLVQETYLRAWKGIKTFTGRGSLRSWMYRIATNACLDMLKRRPRRDLPPRRVPPADPGAPLRPPVGEPIWLEPYADELTADPEASVEARYSAVESVSLAFVTVLQSLPPRQRAVLLLVDVLDWSTGETAELLAATVPAVHSALHRARATLSARYHQEGGIPAYPESGAGDPGGRLARYVKAWEDADAKALASLLKEDASFSMPPVPTWYLGREAIAAALAAGIFAGEAGRRWLLRPAGANRQPAFAVYQRQESGNYALFGMQLLEWSGEQIATVVTFLDPRLFRFFGLPVEIHPGPGT
jgi:RNA polymerase sigma-70 factor (ECF subfamily)